MSTSAEVTVAATEGPEAAEQVRYVIVAVVVTMLASFAVIAGALYLWYQEVPLALGVGGFVAFWGGGGFGVVAGMAIYNLKVERREAVEAGGAA